MRFAFTHSHAFPGSRVAVEEDGAEGCLVEFGDGTTVIGRWRCDGEAIELEIPAYRTARGNPVDARRWRLVRSTGSEWRSRRSGQDGPGLSGEGAPSPARSDLR